jgi:cellobiose-specific phosphotransferase system component IIC
MMFQRMTMMARSRPATVFTKFPVHFYWMFGTHGHIVAGVVMDREF